MMKNMKKLFCFALAVVMMLSVMAGCAAKTEQQIKMDTARMAASKQITWDADALRAQEQAGAHAAASVRFD